MNARTRIPEHIQHRVLDRSRRRCALCVHFDADWGQKEGQIAHLDRNPSNFAEDNLAFLCLPHHDDYDTKRRQTKNLTITEAKTARNRLYAFVEGGGDLAMAGRQYQSVTSANQSGGITAHTVLADTINLYASHPTQTLRPSWQLSPLEAHPSSFIDDGQTLCRPRSLLGMEQVLDIVWYNEPQFFIRLVPSQPPAKPWNFTHVNSMVNAGRLLPLPSYYESYFSAPNQFGAVVLNLRRVEDQNSAEQITQVSRYGEIWGIDKRSAVFANKINFGEVTIAHALKGYLSFAHDQLRLTPPLTIMAGFTGVHGFEFQHPMKQHVFWNPSMTHCNSSSILWQGEIPDLNEEPKAILLPFFDTVWDHCALSREDWFPEDYQ
jgi:hypothetical protein